MREGGRKRERERERERKRERERERKRERKSEREIERERREVKRDFFQTLIVFDIEQSQNASQTITLRRHPEAEVGFEPRSFSCD